MAPEIVRKVPYSPVMADIWALGILFYVLTIGRFPFKGSSEIELYQKISKGKM